MADGSTIIHSGFVNSHRGRVTKAIMGFLTNHGPSCAGFIADTYGLHAGTVTKRCYDLEQQGLIVHWYFDGLALYALPKDAPSDPAVLNAPRQTGRGQRHRKSKDSLYV